MKFKPPYASAMVRHFFLAIYNLLTASVGQQALLRLRRSCLENLGIQLGIGNCIGPGFFCLHGYHLKLGDKVVIGYHCHIYDWSPIEIGDDTLISNDLKIVSASHDANDFSPTEGPIIIGKSCWIGINVTIIGPARIGDNTIVGAGSVVLGDLPANSVCVGTPAKPIRTRQ